MTNAANVEKLMKDLKVLSRDAEAILHATAGQAGEKLGDLRDRLSGALESAKATCRNAARISSQARFHCHQGALLLATNVHVSGPPPWCSTTQRLV